MSPAKRPPESTEALRASLLDHARRLLSRDGPSALTMRALAAEAGCAIGLPYKVFLDRHELVLEIVHSELAQLQKVGENLVGRAGSGSVGGNLTWFAEVVLRSPAVALAHEVVGHDQLAKAMTERVHRTGVGPSTIEQAFAGYLSSEQQARRIDQSINTDAFAFLLAGAIHNLIMSGDAYPRPTKRQLQRHMAAVASALAPSHRRPHPTAGG
jgi:AcrR family transcriptional regulator